MLHSPPDAPRTCPATLLGTGHVVSKTLSLSLRSPCSAGRDRHGNTENSPNVSNAWRQQPRQGTTRSTQYSGVCQKTGRPRWEVTQNRELSREPGRMGILRGQPGFRQKHHGAMFCKAARAMWESVHGAGWGCWASRGEAQNSSGCLEKRGWWGHTMRGIVSFSEENLSMKWAPTVLCG